MGFSRQGYWSELSFPPPGDLPLPSDQTRYLMPPALAEGFFTTGISWTAPQVVETPNLEII